MEAQREALRDPVLSESALSDLERLELRLGTLFHQDARGRLLEARCGAGEPPPRFLFGRTACGNLWRFRSDLPDALVRELARLAAAERTSAELEAPPERDAVLRARLAEAAPIEEVALGAAFRFPEAIDPPADADLREIGPGEPERIAEAFPALAAELAARSPCFAVLEAGRPVSVCYAATGPGPRVEAGVATLPGHRGRGLASLALAAWARALRARGSVPLFSAPLGDRGARGVARRLGLIRYATDLRIR